MLIFIRISGFSEQFNDFLMQKSKKALKTAQYKRQKMSMKVEELRDLPLRSGFQNLFRI